jgi:hypothetical protein
MSFKDLPPNFQKPAFEGPNKHTRSVCEAISVAWKGKGFETQNRGKSLL